MADIQVKRIQLKEVSATFDDSSTGSGTVDRQNSIPCGKKLRSFARPNATGKVVNLGHLSQGGVQERTSPS
jgi:hypothetical protein